MTPTPGHIRQAANEAALAVSGLDFDLLAAASADVDAADARRYLVAAFTKFRPFLRAMKALEDAAPASARAGYEADDRARDFAEERAA